MSINCWLSKTEHDNPFADNLFSSEKIAIIHGYRYFRGAEIPAPWSYVIIPVMKGLNETIEDDFWTERLPFFTAQFPTYYRKPQQVHGRVHTTNERYFDTQNEIIPITQRSGHRTYVLMHPYVLEPNFSITVRLHDKPKHYADQESPIGDVIRSEHTGFREVALGSAQAWYFPTDKTIVLWECFFDSRFHIHPFATDTNMKKLWQAFERYLRQKFPQASTLATPFNDPIAESIEEYQAFLKTLGYSPIAKAAYGKKVRLPTTAL